MLRDGTEDKPSTAVVLSASLEHGLDFTPPAGNGRGLFVSGEQGEQDIWELRFLNKTLPSRPAVK